MRWREMDTTGIRRYTAPYEAVVDRDRRAACGSPRASRAEPVASPLRVHPRRDPQGPVGAGGAEDGASVRTSARLGRAGLPRCQGVGAGAPIDPGGAPPLGPET